MITLGLYLVATTEHGVHRLVPDLRAGAVLHRRGHRRRVLGDQLRDRRADPRAGARLGRPGDQRQLLDRYRGRRGGVGGAAEPQVLRRRHRLAGGVRHGRGARAGRALAAPVPAREPALADDPRPRRRGRGGGGPDRGARRGQHRRKAREARRDDRGQADAERGVRPGASARSSATTLAGRCSGSR